VNKYIFTIIAILLLNNCSLNKNSSLWDNKQIELEEKKNYKKVLVEDKKIISELNKDLKINLSKIELNNNNFFENENNFGSQKYDGKLNKIGKYNFSKLNLLDKLNSTPIFFEDGVIFFDKKGSIIRFNKNQKVLWKVNYYSKQERKLQPKLNFILDDQNILITDNIAKYYSIDLSNGKLKWSKSNTYPFNSEIKKYKDKIFVVDYENTLRCFKIMDGSECWKLKTEDSFRISNSIYSVIITNNTVIFNNSLGDITAADLETGLIVWQLPTQSINILKETHNFKMSNLVSDSKSVFFSNTKNEFYSLDVISGTLNWRNEVNSDINPVIIGNLIFSISREGFLYVIDKNNGNIIRITDVYSGYRFKKVKEINPIGFAIGNKNLYLTNNDGKVFVVDLNFGNTIKIEKISGNIISQPFIFNNNLYIVRDGSILQYN